MSLFDVPGRVGRAKTSATSEHPCLEEKNKMSETDADIESVTAWVMLIEDLLNLVPDRVAVLKMALDRAVAEEAAAAETGSALKIETINLSKLGESPRLPYWHTIMRLKSLVVQVFVRDIVNNHSPERGQEILFSHHQHGNGSGDLRDYIGRAGGC